ncbi:DUF4307 domain-containing protein [Gordonia rubripertincta]|uniref:DUF4307 domain-containing protein n=2 Tax=Gordonia rubripertincta TaxID=36822 RepID=A0AAW6R7Y7_GORRU|nr:DUF4307 domain-containing protein [Gordonia rubripertincta]ASR02432.1 hypothetical protein GCWB2_08115 [Gordonia rubripertincta]MBM7277396.1 DUF4307 domain-containing protein [Gordonia rubripertincta]MDG6780255.1 DUF4307 domain-containing protein [Gordonia rubripertincta]NKY63542.1 DUF4307 domain-containing protein [Gordonia rubripertincta]QMU20456.1 DUF4307 domain-containing protein [Gordonia rubripertincta]
MNSSDGGAAERPRSGPRATYPENSASAQTRRRWFLALSILVVVAGVTLAAVGYSKFGTADVSGEATGYEILDDNTVAVQFTVDRSDPSKPAACVVRGRSKDGSETGRREILIPADSAERIGVRTEVTTSKPPVIGEVFGCTVDVPAYLQPES